MNSRFKLHAERPQATLDHEPFHHWDSPGGALWTEFFRFDDLYLLRFPGLADFTVATDSLDVECHPAPGVTPQTIQHLYHNQVVPLVRSKQGQLVFHASAVVIDDRAVAFVAESGRGKSTLAAGFALAGHPFLSDDGLVVEPDGETLMALPSHPSIRLWDDSEQALMAPGVQRAPPLSYTRKARFLADDELRFCASPRPLGNVYFLGEQSDEVEITPVKGSDAMIEWVKHSFLLDIEERPRLASHFEQVGAVTRRLDHYRVDYPRAYDALERVMQAVIEHSRQVQPAVRP